jgi:TolB-like protein
VRFYQPLLAALLPVAGAAAAAASPVQSAPEPSGIVLILPFSSPAGAKDAWIGDAIQQDLIADLTQGTHTIIEAPSKAPPATDAAQAISTARSMGAAIVVYGQVQTTGTQVRLTGRVLEVSDGRALGVMKATGPSTDLFHAEDALAGQALAALPRSMLNPQVLEAIQQGRTAQPNDQSQPGAAPPATPPTEPAPPAEDYTSVQVPVRPGYQPPQEQPYTYTYVAPPDYTPVYTYPDYSYDYSYGCPMPAYSYSCPSIGLFPFGGVYGFVGGDLDDFGGHARGDGFHHHWEGGAHGYHNGVTATGHGLNGSAPGGHHGGFVAGGHAFASPGARPYSSGRGFSYSQRPSIRYRSAPSMGQIRPNHSGGYAGGLSHANAFRSGGFGGGFHGNVGGFHGNAGGFHSGGGGGGGSHGGGGGRR